MTERDFFAVLSDVVSEIYSRGSNYLRALSDSDFEEVIYEALLNKGLSGVEYKKGSSVFPDITFENYGVEVKTTQKDGWTTLGGSIMEGTKKEGIQIIYITFLKKGGAPEIKIGKYEECLSDIKVTHSPRYEINMLLEESDSIFHKLGIPYDEFSSSENKVKLLRKYYKEKLKGSYPWWIEEDSDKISNIAIRELSSLSREDQIQIEIELIALHPEAVGSEYTAASIYLLTKHNLFDKSMRDRFTAGGRETSVFNGLSCNYSHIIIWVKEHWEEVKEYLNNNQNLFLTINGIDDTSDIIKTWMDLANSAFEKSQNTIKVDETEKSLIYFLTEIL